ncbi:MAG: hypothetical protein GY938_12170 [Ketobacter sp.]|nr:hypothetical protein [Ketobacter sp.]
MAQAPVAGVAGAVEAFPCKGNQARQGEVFLLQQFFAGDQADGFAVHAGFAHGGAGIAVGVGAGCVAVSGVFAAVGLVGAIRAHFVLAFGFGGAVKTHLGFDFFEFGHQFGDEFHDFGDGLPALGHGFARHGGGTGTPGEGPQHHAHHQIASRRPGHVDLIHAVVGIPVALREVVQHVAHFFVGQQQEQVFEGFDGIVGQFFAFGAALFQFAFEGFDVPRHDAAPHIGVGHAGLGQKSASLRDKFHKFGGPVPHALSSGPGVDDAFHDVGGVIPGLFFVHRILLDAGDDAVQGLLHFFAQLGGLLPFGGVGIRVEFHAQGAGNQAFHVGFALGIGGAAPLDAGITLAGDLEGHVGDGGAVEVVIGVLQIKPLIRGATFGGANLGVGG